MSEFTSHHSDYLMRSALDQSKGRRDEAFADEDVYLPDPRSVALVEIAGISRTWGPDQPHQQRIDPKRHQYHIEDVLVGCCGSIVPVVYGLFGSPQRVQLFLGTTATAGHDLSETNAGEHLAVIAHLLPGQYPGIQTRKHDSEAQRTLVERMANYAHAGVVTGMPSNRPIEEEEAPTQIDRLIRTMQGAEWGLVVIASPVDPVHVSGFLAQVLNEMRAVESMEQTRLRRDPRAETYLGLLQALQQEYLAARSVGLWSVNAYAAAGDAPAFKRLAAAVRACFGGEDSKPDPVRVIECPSLPDIASRCGQILTRAPKGPGLVQTPLAYQTLMHSGRLAVMTHLPRHEMPGFIVRDQARFDVAPHHDVAEAPIELGQIIDRGQAVGDCYRITTDTLNKHALVVGVTGSGKTNTTFHLLRAAQRLGIPFLVIEPAKTEYRALLADATIGPRLQIFTVGDETVSPYRVNPFEVESGVSIATHIDLLKATFNASFAMWAPLPQVLERCLHAVYQDRGWDTVRNRNRRLRDEDRAGGAVCAELAFPTLTELHHKIEEVVNRLGYEERVTSDIKAALAARMHSLRIGGKGAMLDTQRSVSLDRVLDRPTVIELEQIGDDEEKAFIMGLLLMRIYERHRAVGVAEGQGLAHLIVIEEAHRLLANVQQVTSTEESSNPRGKAVEAFVNMLSEVRAYGQGFIVAEQIPSKLALDVIKNTNLKVVHRTVAGDDRKILAETMNMPDKQSSMLATIDSGQAAVFAEGDDRPIMVKVPYAKLPPAKDMATRAGSDRVVADHMGAFRADDVIARTFLPFPAYPASGSWPGQLIEFAQEMVERPVMRELLGAVALAALEHPPAVPAALRRLRSLVLDHAPQYALSDEGVACALVHGIDWYLAYFGRRFDWAYEHVYELTGKMTNLMVGIGPNASADAGVTDGPRSEVLDFQSMYLAACGDVAAWLVPIEGLDPGRAAILRYHTELLLRDRSLTELFDEGMADAADTGEWADLRAMDQAVARLGGFELPDESQHYLAIAYAMQQITYKPGLLQMAREMAAEQLLSVLAEHYVSPSHDVAVDTDSVAQEGSDQTEDATPVVAEEP